MRPDFITPKSFIERCRLSQLTSISSPRRLQQLAAVFMLLLSLNCGDAQEPRKNGLLADGDGKIRAVAMNFPWTDETQYKANWRKFVHAVDELSSSMSVYVVTYTGADPSYFRKYELWAFTNKDTGKVDSLGVFIDWLGSLEERFGLDSTAYIGKSVSEFSDFKNRYSTWSGFESDFIKSGSSDTINGSDDLDELRDLIHYFSEKRKTRMDSSVASLKTQLESNKWPVHVLSSVKVDDQLAKEIRDSLCDNEYEYLPTNIKWIQDKILVSTMDGFSTVHSWCDNDFSTESCLIAHSLVGKANVWNIVGEQFCVDGANVIKTHELIVAQDELEWSNNQCSSFAVSVDSLKRRIGKALGENKIRWLEIPEMDWINFAFSNDRHKLPMAHMDMFLNFVPLGDDSFTDWAAFIGTVSTDFYNVDYPYLGERLWQKDTMFLDSLAKRFDQVADTIEAWGYDVRRVPLLVEFHGQTDSTKAHDVLDFISFNNVFTEGYLNKNDVFMKNVFIPSYDTLGVDSVKLPKGVKSNMVDSLIREAYSDFDSIYYIDGIFDEKQASLHCHFKVIQRE